jgi:hypothetical protein
MHSATCWTLLCSFSLLIPSYCGAAPSIQWVKSFGPDVAMGGGGPLAAANSEVAYAWLKNSGGTALHKIDSLGNVLWTRQLEIANFDNAGITVDDIGNAYLSWDASDLFVQKHSPDGDIAWTRTQGTPSADRLYATAVDYSGNVYIAGGTGGSLAGPNQGGLDAVLSKYDSAGNLNWTRQWGTPKHETFIDIGADKLGNVFVGEQKVNPGESLPASWSLSKRTNTGDVLWTRDFPLNGSQLAIDDLGNSIVGGVGFLGYKGFLAKLNAVGDVLWSREVSASHVALDQQGNTYLANNLDAELKKYSPNGDHLWTLPVTNGAPGNIYSVDVDKDGLVFVSGRTLGPSGIAGPAVDTWLALINEPVPEPASFVLLAIAATGQLILYRRR